MSESEKTQIDIAEPWLQSMGKPTRRTKLQVPGGVEIPGLEIHHGSFVLVAYSPPGEESKFLVVKMFANLPASLRGQVGRLGDETRRQLTDDVFELLQANPRSGYAVMPQGVAEFSRIEQMSLEQVMRLDQSDNQSFNRLADAVQELVSGMTRIGRRIGSYVELPKQSGSSRAGDSPSEMFR